MPTRAQFLLVGKWAACELGNGISGETIVRCVGSWVSMFEHFLDNREEGETSEEIS